MPKEIERRFLLDSSCEPEFVINRLKTPKSISDIEQVYLVTGRDQVRIRSVRKDFKDYFYLTAKTGFGLEREEHEILLSSYSYDRLFKAANKLPLRKKRYQHSVDSFFIYIDVFDYDYEGRTLCIIEAEFKSKEEALQFEPLSWFGHEITRSVNLTNQQIFLDINQQGG